MANKQVQFRRGTTAENDSFIGAEGELTVDTERKEFRLHDGSTAGGFLISQDVYEVSTNPTADWDRDDTAATNLTLHVGSIVLNSTNNTMWACADDTPTAAVWLQIGTANLVQSVNSKTGVSITLVPSDLGLGNVNNTSDANKPISTATQAALDDKEDSANKGAANGYAGLDANQDVPLDNIPVLTVEKIPNLNTVYYTFLRRRGF